jgi:hypothetical protein
MTDFLRGTRVDGCEMSGYWGADVLNRLRVGERAGSWCETGYGKELELRRREGEAW